MPPDGEEAGAAGPTDSHILSQTNSDDDGLVSKAANENETLDIGWGTLAPDDLNERIVAGISNEDLWMLIRRFNKVATFPALHRREKC